MPIYHGPDTILIGAVGVSEFEFTCAYCGASILVDDETSQLLLEDGCAVCGAYPDGEAFEPTAGE